MPGTLQVPEVGQTESWKYFFLPSSPFYPSSETIQQMMSVRGNRVKMLGRRDKEGWVSATGQAIRLRTQKQNAVCKDTLKNE